MSKRPSPEEFIEQHGGYWDGEYPDYPVADWQYEVANGDTRKGYWEWAYASSVSEDEALTNTTTKGAVGDE